MGDITREEMRERLGNIDQIRDIIFGSQLRDYDSRIAKLDADFAVLQQEVRDRFDQIKTGFSSELKTAIESLEKRLKSGNTKAQEENEELRQQADHLNKKFSSSIAALDESLDRQTSSLRSELTQTRDKLQEESTTLRDLVFEELDRRFSSLKDMKLSKDDMAETLFELGMRLKGTEFIPKLREVADNSDNCVHIPLLETQKVTEVVRSL